MLALILSCVPWRCTHKWKRKKKVFAQTLGAPVWRWNKAHRVQWVMLEMLVMNWFHFVLSLTIPFLCVFAVSSQRPVWTTQVGFLVHALRWDYASRRWEISDAEWNFFLRGSAGVDKVGMSYFSPELDLMHTGAIVYIISWPNHAYTSVSPGTPWRNPMSRGWPQQLWNLCCDIEVSNGQLRKRWVGAQILKFCWDNQLL